MGIFLLLKVFQILPPRNFYLGVPFFWSIVANRATRGLLFLSLFTVFGGSNKNSHTRLPELVTTKRYKQWRNILESEDSLKNDNILALNLKKTNTNTINTQSGHHPCISISGAKGRHAVSCPTLDFKLQNSI